MQKRIRPRSRKGATELAQFPLTIYCLFLVVLLPVLNLVTLLIAGTTAYLATNDLAAKAATQPSFARALNAMAVEAYSFQSNSLAQFVRMSPQGGYTGCGNDLYILSTDMGGAGVQASAADQTLTAKIDTTKNIYEMQVVSSYSVSPLVSLAAVPLFGGIPGLGQPVSLTFAASRPIEHPGGMEAAPQVGGGTGGVGGGGATPFNKKNPTAPGVTPPTTPVTWRTPNIYQQIASAGQTVVSVNVVMAFANQPFQFSNVTVQAGQKLWIDTQASGLWDGQVDANGVPGTASPSAGFTQPFPSANFWSLIGYVGPTPQSKIVQNAPYGVMYVYPNNAFTNDPNCFAVGNTLTNHPVPSSGKLSFMTNNLTPGSNDFGKQMIRIIVTQ